MGPVGTTELSIIMPLRGDGPFLGEALDSVFNQDFKGLELILVNDGMTTPALEQVAAYLTKEPRLRVVDNTNAPGIAGARNCGVDAAAADLVAQMDSDDIALPNRFAKQVVAMKSDSSLGILGTWADLFVMENGKRRVLKTFRPPEQDLDIRWCLLFSTCLRHPTVMMRRSLLNRLGGYLDSMNPAEDYDLWCRAASLTKFGNLQETLLLYRWHDANVSQVRVDAQENARSRAFPDYVLSLLDLMTPEGLELATLAYREEDRLGSQKGDILRARRAADWVEQLADAFIMRYQPDIRTRVRVKGQTAGFLRRCAWVPGDPFFSLSCLWRAYKWDGRMTMKRRLQEACLCE